MVRGGNRPRLRILCTKCGAELAPLARACPRCPDALPRSDYAERAFVLLDREDIFRFAAWLPAKTTVATTIGPVIARSEKLASSLGLPDVSIAFSGYCPELGARNVTGTFKDFEALPTLLYLRENGASSVVLASAGNTARAFAYAATILEFPTYIIVPESAVSSVRIPVEPSACVRLISLSGSSDYSAAIEVAEALADRHGILSEGGARNVARRDGMGTTVLEYVRTQGRLPDHYVQAIGSGTGAIAAWEAAMRLQAGGAVDNPVPHLHLAQNAPFTPIHDAWTSGREIAPERDVESQLRRIGAISSPVLANRKPPFSVVGGVRNALLASGGQTYAVTNAEIAASQALFERCVGTPVGPETGAALAALAQGVARGWIGRAQSVLLHATGNQHDVLRRDVVLHAVPVWQRVSSDLEAALNVLGRAISA
jgi:cysteate synthase